MQLDVMCTYTEVSPMAIHLVLKHEQQGKNDHRCWALERQSLGGIF